MKDRVFCAATNCTRLNSQKNEDNKIFPVSGRKVKRFICLDLAEEMINVYDGGVTVSYERKLREHIVEYTNKTVYLKGKDGVFRECFAL